MPATVPDAPLGVGLAARIAVHDRVVGDAAPERIVLGAIARPARARAARLRRRACPPPRAPCARRRRSRGRRFGDAPAARALRDPLELVGGLVDRLEVALVFELPALRREVGMPALGHPAARELHVALGERRLELQEEKVLLDIEDRHGHDPTTLATAARPILRANVFPIRIHDAPAVEGPPAGQDGARQHHARVPAGREDRGPRLQRRGQVDAASHHGGRRAGVPRRRRAGAGGERRDARAGAPARREQGRARQRRGRRRRDEGAARPLQRARRRTTPRRRPRSSARSRRRSTRPTPGTSTRSSNTRWTPCACPPATPT